MLYRFEDLKVGSRQAERIGKKAESLIQMRDWGFQVPDGCCLSTDTLRRFLQHNNLLGRVESFLQAADLDRLLDFDTAHGIEDAVREGSWPQDVLGAIHRFLREHPDSHFAVRSSGTLEDLPGASFAGLYTTTLDVVCEEDVLAAVKQSWASLFTRRVLEYALHQGADVSTLGLAVILQEMVPAEKSGVAFGVDPVNGTDREVVIEACFGLGEALVSGSVTPDRYRYDWYRRMETSRAVTGKTWAALEHQEATSAIRDETPHGHGSDAVLSPDEVSRLADLTVRIQAEYGFPVDIEWAACQGQFHVLQCRPITEIGYAGIEGEWTTADFKDGGVSSDVCCAFMWSLYDTVWEATLPAYLKKIKLLREDAKTPWGEMFFGRPYWNLTGVKDALARLPGYVERHFDEDLGIQPAYEGDGHTTRTTLKTVWTGIRSLLALRKSFRAQTSFCGRFAAGQRARLGALDAICPEFLSRDDFFVMFEHFVRDDYFQSEATYFNLIYDNSNLMTLFKDELRKTGVDADLLVLISGLQDLSHLELNVGLHDLAQKIRSDEDTLHHWVETSVGDLIEEWERGDRARGMDDVRAFLHDFKYHSSRELDITVPRFGEDPSFVFSSIKDYLTLSGRPTSSVSSREGYEAYERERSRLLRGLPSWSRGKMDAKLTQLRSFLWWREELRDLSTRFYYHVRRFTLTAGRHFEAMGILGEPEDIFHLRAEDIFRIHRGQLSPQEATATVERNKLYYRSFRNFQNADEIGADRSGQRDIGADATHTHRGVACSPGICTAKARVIESVFDADRLQEGDILITKYTDPGWSPKFGLLAGVATETGGLLSHAAVISREYGIPAVLAVPNITQLLRDGQAVTVDGSRGEIRVAAPE